MRRPRRSGALTDALDDAVAFHTRQLCAYGARRQLELRRNVVGSETAMSEERHDAAATRVQKLLSQHVGQDERSVWRRDRGKCVVDLSATARGLLDSQVATCVFRQCHTASFSYV